LASAFQLIVAQDGVHRDKDAAVKAVGVLHQLGDVLNAVVRCGARPKRRAANVDGVRAMVDGFDADVEGTGRGKKFEVVRLHGLGLSLFGKLQPWMHGDIEGEMHLKLNDPKKRGRSRIFALVRLCQDQGLLITIWVAVFCEAS
jgi:hypothetical protein